jgi:hypothetical protein
MTLTELVMEAKKIRIDLEAYDLLLKVRKEGESLSQTIMRGSTAGECCAAEDRAAPGATLWAKFVSSIVHDQPKRRCPTVIRRQLP